MSEKRRGLGRGLGALIPSGSTPVTRPAGDRPVDVFFADREEEGSGPDVDRELAASVVGVPSSSGSGGSANGSSGANGERGGHATRPVRSPLIGAPASPMPGARPAMAPTALHRAPGGVTPARTPADLDSTTRLSPASSPTQADTVTASGMPVTAEDAGAGPSVPSATVVDESVELVPVPGAYFAEIPVTAIRPNPKQPRQVFDEEALAELVQSVKEVGVLQPVVVRRISGAAMNGNAEHAETGEWTGTAEAAEAAEDAAQFELIMGERRLRACRDAGLERIPAIVRDTQDDALLRDALLENLHRSQLNPLEEAAAYQQLLDDFGCTHEDLATRIGRSRPQISNTLRLLKLPPLVQRRVAASVLSAGHARALLGLEDSAAMERLAQRIVAEGLSVRAVEEIVALGDGTIVKPAKRRPRAGAHTSELDELASRLGDRLDTRVAIALGRNKGRLSIDFASVDDLNRILGLLSPQLRGAFKED